MAKKKRNRAARKTPVEPQRAQLPALRPPKPIPRTAARRPLPAKSVKNAARAFQHFSLSRFPAQAVPAHFVPPKEVRNSTAVQAVQRRAMARQVNTLAARAPASPGLTLALPPALIAKLLPSFDGAAGTVELGDLLGALRQRMRGTDFYTVGNPTLKRVVQDGQLQSQVQAFIDAIKAGGV